MTYDNYDLPAEDDEALEKVLRSFKPRYPEIEVQLVGEDGNAFFIISRVRAALKEGGVSHHEIEEFSEEAMSGDYDGVIQTCMRWVSTS